MTGTTGLPRVLFLASHSQLGGSEKVLEDLVAELPSATVAGVVALQEGPLVDILRARPGSVAVIPTSGSPASMAGSSVRLARHVRRTRPQVVHGNGVKAALVAVAATRLAAPLRPVPVVWMKHDVTLDGPVGRALARRCAAVACVSEEVARGLAPAGRTVIVHPGIRVGTRAVEDATTLRRRLGTVGPVVSVIGRLDPAKGHAELLEALPDVLRSVPRATALLVGPDDPHHPGVRAQLGDRARVLRVADHVLLPGPLPSATVIAASDVVCVPTVPRADGTGREGFGLVAAEALALGRPVVGYDVGATGEVLAGCGTLVRPGDRSGLARAITRSLASAFSDTEAAGRCVARAGELTVERMAQQLLDLYRDVAG
jgi:glycosyltransferase involved in cell wall biosynthesis